MATVDTTKIRLEIQLEEAEQILNRKKLTLRALQTDLQQEQEKLSQKQECLAEIQKEMQVAEQAVRNTTTFLFICLNLLKLTTFVFKKNIYKTKLRYKNHKHKSAN